MRTDAQRSGFLGIVKGWFLQKKHPLTGCGQRPREGCPESVPDMSYKGRYYPGRYTSALPKNLPNDRNTLVDSYRFTPPPYEPGSKGFGTPGRYVEYIVRTGSAWEGTIEKINFSFTMHKPVCAQLFTLPGSLPGGCVSKNEWRSAMTDINPKNDYRLVIQ